MTGIYVGLGLLALIVILQFAMLKSLQDRTRRQKQRYDHLLRGNDPDVNIEELLNNLNDQIESSHKELRNINKTAADAKDTTMGAVSNMAVVHFDAFEGQSRELSFALCMLDNFHNGIILTSLYGDDGANVYLKEIVNGACKGELSEAETKALNKAKR
ncbi:DUF4446 family protein [Anaerococcus lactolyticus]|uniref:DUF4446 domain-containing protein n=2 Tax=Anaerococcus lactolyticus TaxID=33032 RepID=C2BFL6_9FIRM|nr:DUF4446 family protein [Anaerococcus lactolyticus]EEI86303.1 hypothetical protein HMPREF0072_1136 [Anaerococcus lactolyticus ATCC 51172]KGF05402.1 hypothetical protein HMPREF1630_00820 [Anaerococcus lactolyticus S7-1-13]